MSAKKVSLLVGTRKGAFILRGDEQRKKWELSDPIFLGHIVYHMVPDPRDKQTIVMAAKTGHLGPTVFRSNDAGSTWTEAASPPAFEKVENEENARAVDIVFWISPGHANEKNSWYAGTSPPGLFRSTDNGDSWTPIDGFNNNPMYKEWMMQGATPAGQLTHAISINPKDPNHMYAGVSVGGVFETKDR